MLNVGALSFATPWLLTALLALPVIWWILRVTPPAPRRERFAAIAFLFGAQREETPARTPLWLLILRLVIAACIILGLAGPLLNAQRMVASQGPLILVIDNGWPAAPNWDRIRSSALALVDQAERAGKTVLLVRTAPDAAQTFAAVTPARAKALLKAMDPQPWLPQRMAVLKAWQAAADAPRSGRVVWLSDGIASTDGKDFAEALAARGKFDALTPTTQGLPLAIRPAKSSAEDLSVDVVRAVTGARRSGDVTAYGEGGKVVGREDFTFAADSALATARFNLPLEIRNEISRIEIDGMRSAGAVTLLDDRWHRRAVGLVASGGIESAQPLLGELYYVQRALEPYADLRKGQISQLIDGHISVLILADVGRLLPDDAQKIAAWVDSGGVLIRFAGANLAAQSDDLVPVPLREGGRVMGGALSWSEPQTLGPFDESSPFYGLPVPPDVTVRRQVLAEPSLELASHTWARLADGTPLVTATARGKGHIVLFHVTANSDWSNLPLSGLFVDMLQRLIDLSAASGAPGATATAAAALTPRQSLDGYGALRPALPTATPISAADLGKLTPDARHPPGLYGPPDALRALNPTRSNEILRPLTDWPAGASVHAYSGAQVVRLGPWLLVAALLLALLDGLAALVLMGKLSLPQRAGHAAALLLAASLILSTAPHARADDAALMDAALHTHLAYVITGDASVDAMSKAGLQGLTERLTAKTALEPDPPIGLNIDKDDITLFPLIYWPVTQEQKQLSPDTDRKLDQYLNTGGMILFDTQDQDLAAADPGVQTPNAAALQKLLQGLDIPPLEPVPQRHVLTRSFYLLNDFPGRFTGGRVWVEAGSKAVDPDDDSREGTVNDGVSSVIIGSNDWASAWAVDGGGRSLAAVIPGGERQRELAYRFGINVAMYALTGNYKGDEVHTRELIKRLGE